MHNNHFNSLASLSNTTFRSYQLCEAFRMDLSRFNSLSLRHCGISVDLSKQLWDLPVVHALQALADSRNLRVARQHLLKRQIVNPTENRSADHAHWRMSCQHHIPAVMLQLLDLATKIRSRQDITHVVHIGIGVSGFCQVLSLKFISYWF